MIVEERIYTLRPGKVPEFLALYEREGMAIQRPILGTMVGYFFTEVGPLNQVIHMWAYKDMVDRAKRRAKLVKNKKWQAYLAKGRDFLVTQENKILNPASFSPTPGVLLKNGKKKK
ncbi:MAG: NIPSNAP family protein [Rhodospirillales bacterium]|nr:NIPSNAP family protein [Rhodospirillales bacterium]